MWIFLDQVWHKKVSILDNIMFRNLLSKLKCRKGLKQIWNLEEVSAMRILNKCGITTEKWMGTFSPPATPFCNLRGKGFLGHFLFPTNKATCNGWTRRALPGQGSLDDISPYPPNPMTTWGGGGCECSGRFKKKKKKIVQVCSTADKRG